MLVHSFSKCIVLRARSLSCLKAISRSTQTEAIGMHLKPRLRCGFDQNSKRLVRDFMDHRFVWSCHTNTTFSWHLGRCPETKFKLKHNQALRHCLAFGRWLVCPSVFNLSHAESSGCWDNHFCVTCSVRFLVLLGWTCANSMHFTFFDYAPIAPWSCSASSSLEPFPVANQRWELHFLEVNFAYCNCHCRSW